MAVSTGWYAGHVVFDALLKGRWSSVPRLRPPPRTSVGVAVAQFLFLGMLSGKRTTVNSGKATFCVPAVQLLSPRDSWWPLTNTASGSCGPAQYNLQ